MGEIIHIEERRRARAKQAPATADMFDWGASMAAYVETVLVPGIAYWRLWTAGWANLWLAPMGLQVLPIDREPPRPPEQANSTR